MSTPSDPRSTIDDRRAAYYDVADSEPESESGEDWHDNGRRAAAADRRRLTRRRWGVLAVVAIVLLPLVLMAGWFYFQVEPRGGEGKEVAVTVEEGAGTAEVAQVLADADVIGSTTAFKVWASITGATPFTPGDYTFRTNMGGRAAANVLKAGPATAQAGPELTLMIPPGLSLNQIADRVAQLPGRSRDQFLQIANSGAIRSKYQPAGQQSLEGMLFPDTYYIGGDEDEEAIIRRLVARTDEIGDRVGLANSAATNGLTPYQTMVAASLIQTEVKVPDEAVLISAVIRNRLQAGQRLEIDSTLCFAKGGCPPVPTNADKAIDSPYNTYKNAGLPPTPISTFTEANLRAAMTPANVPYRYYVVSDANGSHAFATTLAEHDANVRSARAKGLL